jgi:hypothetical protein
LGTKRIVSVAFWDTIYLAAGVSPGGYCYTVFERVRGAFCPTKGDALGLEDTNIEGGMSFPGGDFQSKMVAVSISHKTPEGDMEELAQAFKSGSKEAVSESLHLQWTNVPGVWLPAASSYLGPLWAGEKVFEGEGRLVYQLPAKVHIPNMVQMPTMMAHFASWSEPVPEIVHQVKIVLMGEMVQEV